MVEEEVRLALCKTDITRKSSCRAVREQRGKPENEPRDGSLCHQEALGRGGRRTHPRREQMEATIVAPIVPFGLSPPRQTCPGQCRPQILPKMRRHNVLDMKYLALVL